MKPLTKDEYRDQVIIARSHADDLRGLAGKRPVDFRSILECFSNDDYLDVLTRFPSKGIKTAQGFAGDISKLGGYWTVKAVAVSNGAITAGGEHVPYPVIHITLDAAAEPKPVEVKRTTMAAVDFQDKLDDLTDVLEDCRASIESIQNMWDCEPMSTEQESTLAHYRRVLEDLQADLEKDKEANGAVVEEEAAEDASASE